MNDNENGSQSPMYPLLDAYAEIVVPNDARRIQTCFRFGRALLEKSPTDLSEKQIAARLAKATGLPRLWFRNSRLMAENIAPREFRSWMRLAKENDFLLTFPHLRQLIRVANPKDRQDLLNCCLEERLTSEELLERVEEVLILDELLEKLAMEEQEESEA